MKRLGVVGLCGFLALTMPFSLPSVAGAEDLTDVSCRIPLTVNLGASDATWKLAAGVRARVVPAAHAAGAGGAFPLGIVRVKPSIDRLAPMTWSMPRVQAPTRYLRRERVVAVTNADFFSTVTSARAYASGSVVRDGEVLSFPGTGSPSLVIDDVGRPRAVHVMVDAHAILEDDTLSISSVNDPRVRDGAVSFYTSAWRASVQIGASTGVVVSNGRVTRVVTGGNPVKLAKGESVIVLPADRDIPEVGSAATVSVLPRAKDGKPIVHATGHAGSIMRQGRIQAPCSAYERIHRPRTTIAWNDEGVTWIIVAGAGQAEGADGVRRGGATKWQMADIAKKLGATWAVSMDGGGSSALVIKTARELRRLDNSADAWLRPLPVAWAVMDTGRGRTVR